MLTKQLAKQNTFFKNNSQCSAANNGWSSAIADCLRALTSKKNWEITKMTNHFSHTKKTDFKTAKAEKNFFF